MDIMKTRHKTFATQIKNILYLLNRISGHSLSLWNAMLFRSPKRCKVLIEYNKTIRKKEVTTTPFLLIFHRESYPCGNGNSFVTQRKPSTRPMAPIIMPTLAI